MAKKTTARALVAAECADYQPGGFCWGTDVLGYSCLKRPEHLLRLNLRCRESERHLLPREVHQGGRLCPHRPARGRLTQRTFGGAHE